MVRHFHLELPAFGRGFHLITDLILDQLPALPESGVLQIFIQHTSAGLSINEAADPDVRHDFQLYFKHLAPENLPGIIHTDEGPDDMPAHVLASLMGSSVQIPIHNARLALGRWQGIFLGEFRHSRRKRSILITIIE
jgi:secondary thiamine-phosphate synthase enzyme